MDPNVLTASDRRGVLRRRFIWIAPLAWSLVVVGARRYRGDEYGWFALASLPAWPLGFLLRPGATGSTMLPWALACGLPVMVPLGWWMDRSGVRGGPVAFGWCLLAAALAIRAVADFPSIDAAIARNGSLWAYAFGSLGFMAPIACFLGALLASLRRSARAEP